MLYAIRNAGLALSLVLPIALASPKPCSDHPGVVHDPSWYSNAGGSSSSNSWSSSSNSGSSGGSSSSQPKQQQNSNGNGGGKNTNSNSGGNRKKAPKVSNPTVNSVTNGASQAVDQFAPYIPSDITSKLQDGLSCRSQSLEKS